MAISKPNTIEEFIANSPEEARGIMISLKNLIEDIEPRAEGSISWNVPIYAHHGILAGFSLAKKHVSFGIDSLSNELRERLEQKGYKTGKKTIQIRFDQTIPEEEIKQLIKAQVRVNEVKMT